VAPPFGGEDSKVQRLSGVRHRWIPIAPRSRVGSLWLTAEAAVEGEDLPVPQHAVHPVLCQYSARPNWRKRSLL
jgi:hypothetical protein